MSQTMQLFQLLLLLFGGETAVWGQPTVDDETRNNYENMKAEWYNTEKYPPTICSKAEQDFFDSCDRFKNNTTPPPPGGDGDDYYAVDAEPAEPELETKARLSDGRCERRECRQISYNSSSSGFYFFRLALDRMMKTLVTSYTEYQVLASYHNSANAPSAHFGAGFCAWHREYLLRFEVAIQKYCPTCCLCFLDWSLDSCIPYFCDSALFSDDYYGPSTGALSGFWAGWNGKGSYTSGCSGTISRNCQENKNNIYTDQSVNSYYSSYGRYENWCYPNYPNFEYWHGVPHNMIGGTMASIPCAVADPLFLAHHCCIDYYWQTARNKETYMPNRQVYPNWQNMGSHAPTASCRPFNNMVNADGLNTKYDSAVFYRHARRNCATDAECCDDGLAGALWCNNGRCCSKIRPQGRCQNLPDRACYRAKNCPYPAWNNGGICDCSRPKPSTA